ncbi:MAG: hypothetical protein AAF430_03510 [Myxococcota bacterium]
MNRYRSEPRQLVGRDFQRVRIARSELRDRPWGWWLCAALVCALALVTLRIDLLRTRYALGELVREEQELLLRRSQHHAEIEALRDPTRLAELARERGFERGRVIELRPELARREDP